MNTTENAKSYRKNAVIVGVFFIIATVASISTFLFIGFLSDPDYLVKVSSNENQVLGGMFLELIWALAVLGIPVFLYPILRKHSEALALGFYSLRFIEALLTIIYSLSLLVLLTLSQEHAATGVPDASYFQTAGTLFLAAREWTFLIGSGFVWSLSALILNYLLYQRKLIPRWLSVWGFAGAALSFANYLPQFFGIDSIEVLFIPIAVQEMVFAVWLIVKGLNSSAVASESAKENR